ncbi:hypothetical protein JCM8097_000257 [Rhodosporidiobolus ruineniae]
MATDEEVVFACLAGAFVGVALVLIYGLLAACVRYLVDADANVPEKPFFADQKVILCNTRRSYLIAHPPTFDALLAEAKTHFPSIRPECVALEANLPMVEGQACGRVRLTRAGWDTVARSKLDWVKTHAQEPLVPIYHIVDVEQEGSWWARLVKLALSG